MLNYIVAVPSRVRPFCRNRENRMPVRIVIVQALLLLAASVASAVDTAEEYATLGGWTIAVDRTLGDGCFATARYEGGSMLRLGFDINDENAYLILGNAKWGSIELGKEYAIRIKFSGHEPWGANAVGFSFDPPASDSYLWIRIAGEADKMDAFVLEYMESSEVEITSNGTLIGKLDLTGSNQAGEKLLECQESVFDTG